MWRKRTSVSNSVVSPARYPRTASSTRARSSGCTSSSAALPAGRGALVAELLPHVHVVVDGRSRRSPSGISSLPDADVRAAHRQLHPFVGPAEHLRLLRPPPLGHVAEDQDDARDAAAVVDDGGAAVVDGRLPAVPGQQRRVVGQPDHRAQAEHLGRGVLDRLPGLLVDDAEHLGQRPPDGVRQRPPRQRLGRRVQEGHPGLGVGRDDRVADARERDRVAALAGRDAAPGAVQGFTQAADERADQHEERQGNRIVCGVDPEGVVRFEEEVARPPRR